MCKATLPDMQSVIAVLVHTLTNKVIMALFVYAERSRSFSIQLQQKRPKCTPSLSSSLLLFLTACLLGNLQYASYV